MKLYNSIFKILIAFAFVISIFNLSHHYINADEGVILNGAWKMYQGEHIYQDFFEYVAPGSFYFIWAVFELFAPTHFVAWFFSMLALVSSAFLLYVISLKINNNKTVAYLVSVLWLLLVGFGPLINHNTFSSLVAVVFAYFFLKLINSQKKMWALAAGVLAGLVVYFLQTKGLAVFLSGLIFLIFYYKYYATSWWFYLLGVSLTASVGWLWWGNYIYSNLLEVSGDYLNLHAHFYQRFSFLIILVSGIVFLAWKYQRQNRQIVFLLILQLFLLLSTMNLPDNTHILINSFPAIVIGVTLAFNFYQSSQRRRALEVLATLALLVLVFVSFYNHGLPSNKALEQRLAQVKNELQGQSIYARPFLPGIYFELEKNNPYYSSTFETELGSKAVLSRNYQIFVDEKPEVVLTNYGVLGKYDYQYNEIDEYIFEHYELVKELGDVGFWERRVISN